MSEKKDNLKILIAYWISLTIGMVVFSQALSFGRWNKFREIEENFNFHSYILGACGIAILLLTIIVYGLYSRIRKLENSD
tara:strand:+ start:394 stop:633 length:240 start_codon:yes stop_codon:yes gene_type:complete